MIVLESCQVSSNQTVCLSMLTNGNCCFKTLEMNGMANLKLNLIEDLIFLLSSQVFSFSMKGRQSLKYHTHAPSNPGSKTTLGSSSVLLCRGSTEVSHKVRLRKYRFSSVFIPKVWKAYNKHHILTYCSIMLCLGG